MKRLFLTFSIIGSLFVVTKVWAQDVVTPTTKTQTATITCNPNLATGACTGTITAGPCSTTPSDYDSLCPSVTGCQCVTFSNAKVSGRMAGSGTASGFVTTDVGSSVPPGAGTDGCTAFFGVIELTTTLARNPQIEDLDINGTTCHHFPGANQNITNGGFGIVSATNGATGWGEFTGTQNKSSSTVNPNVAVYHLKGSITTP